MRMSVRTVTGTRAPPCSTRAARGIFTARLGFLALWGGLGLAAADGWAESPPGRLAPLETGTVEVIGDTPLPGLGVARDEVPSNVQALSGKELQRRQSSTLPEFFDEALPSVNTNGISGNPYQPNLNYRGFTASPLLGTPQGLSVYLDGMRLNEPFGELVNWDLIPQNALSALNLLPGSNPVFGLNTLGGALSLRTKSGENHPGTALEAGGGSFGRWQVEGEHGGSRGPLGWFVAGNVVEDQGWRDFSPSRVNQGFAKLGYQTRDTDLDLSILGADNRLTGNQLTPSQMLQQRWESVYTQPDVTDNRAWGLNLTASREISESLWLGGNVHHRETRTGSSNPDVNQIRDERVGVVPYEDDPTDIQRSAALNRSNLTQKASGLTLQATWQPQDASQLTAGVAFERGDATFVRSYQLGSFTADRGVTASGDEIESVNLDGGTRTESVYATYNWRFVPAWSLTASARYNRTHVTTEDHIGIPFPPPAKGLDNDFTYSKLNPAFGLTFQPASSLTLYGSYGQGSRAPSPIELACADKEAPCLLPNAMQSDPFLEQVVTRTLEGGVRGKMGAAASWDLSLFRADSQDDILFVSAGNSQGYFQNFGRTRRQGLEASLSGQVSAFDWSFNYALVDATFQSDATIVSPGNSTRGTAPGTAADEILVSAGDRIPGIPLHQFRLGGGWMALPGLRLGASVIAFSSQYVRGNENNQHQAGTFNDRTFEGSGTVPGYAVVNLTAAWNFTPQWELLGRVSNLFDKRYSTSGQLGEDAFPNGSFESDPELWRNDTFYAPGAPRALWVALRFSDAK